MKILIYDIDSLLFATAYSFQESTLEEACNHVDNYMLQIANKCDATHGLVCITEGKSFRKKEYPEYKANRKNVKFPDLLNPIRNYVKNKYKALTVESYEADDLIFIARRVYSDLYPDSQIIIASSDKDCLQFPGEYINLKSGETRSISQEEADRIFWTQMITGDTADNIKGIQGSGIKAAEKMLSKVSSKDYPKEVLQGYIDKYGEFKGVELFYINYRTLRLRIDDPVPVNIPYQITYGFE